MGRDKRNPTATTTAPLLTRTSEYYTAQETPTTTATTRRTRRTSLSTTDPPPPPPALHSQSSSSSSSTTDSHKGTSRHIDHPPARQPLMSTSKYAQDIERDLREPLVSKRSDPSRAAKEASIRQKLRTYEAIVALSEGYMPTTEQLTQWARYALRPSGVLDSRNRRLSSHGRGFVKDVRAWVEAVVELGLSKNSDDKIQEFIYNTSHAQISARGPGMSGAMMGGDGATTSAMRPPNPEMQKMYKRLRNLGSLLYSSPEFRKLLNDTSVLAREILADAASQVGNMAITAADQLRPSEAETSNIDKPAESGLGDKSSQPPSSAQLKSQAKEKGRDYSEQARKKSHQTRDDVEAYLRQKFPKQRRDAVVNRLKRVLTEIQNNPDFQESVDFMMALVRKYGMTLKDKMAQEAQRTKESGVQTDEHFDRALMQAKAILMVFADGKPLDDISDAFHQVMEDVQNEHELKDFYNDVTGFIQRALTDKNFVISDAADAEAHRLYDRSQELLGEKKDKYRPDIERLFEELRSYKDCISNDPENRRVVETSKKVFNDLVILDKKGQFKGFRRKVVRDIVDVLLPRFIGDIRYIPMPRIEYQDRDFDLILENVILESDHFIPYRMLFEAFTRAEFINDYTFTSKYAGTTRITIEGINLFFKDASFILRKKTGLTFSDSGFFDVFMDGRGASAELILDSVMDDTDDEDNSTNESYFHVRSVKVTIHKFRYNYNAYHSWAAAILAPIIRPSIRRLLSRLLEQKIREVFEMADRELYAVAERMRVASIASQGGGSVEAWIRAVFSRPDMGRRHGGGAFRVNVGTEEVLFPGEHAPGSLTTKIKAVRERVEVGGEGEGGEEGFVQAGWRNDIFFVRA